MTKLSDFGSTGIRTRIMPPRHGAPSPFTLSLTAVLNSSTLTRPASPSESSLGLSSASEKEASVLATTTNAGKTSRRLMRTSARERQREGAHLKGRTWHVKRAQGFRRARAGFVGGA